MPLTAEEERLPGNEGVRFFAYNPSQNLAIRFADSSTRIDTGTQEVTISRGDVGAASLVTEGERAEFRHRDGVVEWWRNQGMGFQQGFVVPVPTKANDTVEIALRVQGMGVTADPANEGDLLFTDRQGEPVLGYRNLQAWDADGDLLTANMRPSEGGLEITVLAAGADFPITIDPVVVRLRTTLAPQAVGPVGPSDQYAQSIAMEGDLAVIGVPADHGEAGTKGAVYVFHWQDGAWQFAERLRVKGKKGKDGPEIGRDVLLSGGQIFTTVSSSANGARAVQVFTSKKGKWKAERLLEAPGDTVLNFGTDLAISGETLCVSGRDDQGGRLWFFQKRGSKWVFAQTLSTDATLTHVSIDGDLAAADGYQGVRIFERDQGVWVHSETIQRSTTESVGNLEVRDGRILFGLKGYYPGTGPRYGTVFLYQRGEGGWEETRIGPPVPEFGSTSYSFGAWVKLHERGLMIADGNGNGIHTFHLDPDPSPGPVIPQLEGFSTFGVFSNFGASGNAIAISGDRMIVGGRLWANSTIRESGIVAYDFSDGAWQQSGFLNPGFNGEGSLEGGSLAITGEKLFFGAPADANPGGISSGCVYVFRRSRKKWLFETRLTAPEPRVGAGFGRTLAAAPGFLAVGSQEDAAEGSTHVVGHVFGNAGSMWTHEASIESPFAFTPNLTGMSMSARGDRLLIGLPLHGETSSGRGCALLYSNASGAWQREKIFVADQDPFNWEMYFGQSVALGPEVLWIGSDRGTDSARVNTFVNEAGDWVETDSIVPAPEDRAGYLEGTLAYSDGFLWIGSPRMDSYRGVVDVYPVESNTVGTPTRFYSTTQITHGKFGYGLAVSGDTAAILSKESDQPRIDWVQRNGDQWQMAGSMAIEGAVTKDEPAITFHGDTLLTLDPKAMTEPFRDEPVMQGVVRHFTIAGLMPDIAVSAGKKNLRNGKATTVPKGDRGLLITIRNTGKAKLVDLIPLLAGHDSNSFEISPLPMDGLLPKESVTFTLKHAADPAARPSAKLVILSNDPDENPFVIHLNSGR